MDRAKDELTDSEEWLEKAVPVINQRIRSGTEFFAKVSHSDYQLIRLLVRDVLDDRAIDFTLPFKNIIEGYEKSSELIMSARQLDPIIDNVFFLEDMISASKILNKDKYTKKEKEKNKQKTLISFLPLISRRIKCTDGIAEFDYPYFKSGYF